MRLRRHEFCPIHKSLSCCGRESLPKPRLIRLGVQRVEDPHHPRGYRELRSPAEMRRLLNRKILEQNRVCPICHEEFTDYTDIVPDHKNPKGMGGAWRDDHPDNIQENSFSAVRNKIALATEHLKKSRSTMGSPSSSNLSANARKFFSAPRQTR